MTRSLYSLDKRYLRKDGSQFWAHISVALKRDSTTDYLTNIANRRVFSERCEDAAKRFRIHHETYGLILLDLDNFKIVNDTFGQDVGDQVLMALGRILKAQIRGQRDIAAGLGGEEFAVLCTGEMNPDLLVQIAERIRTQVNAEVIDTSKGGIQVTCSFGAALSSAADLDWKGIYTSADAALYSAKKSGKNRVALAPAFVDASQGKPPRALLTAS